MQRVPSLLPPRLHIDAVRGQTAVEVVQEGRVAGGAVLVEPVGDVGASRRIMTRPSIAVVVAPDRPDLVGRGGSETARLAGRVRSGNEGAAFSINAMSP